jgi:hypothetical protein
MKTMKMAAAAAAPRCGFAQRVNSLPGVWKGLLDGRPAVVGKSDSVIENARMQGNRLRFEVWNGEGKAVPTAMTLSSDREAALVNDEAEILVKMTREPRQ